MPQQIFLCEKGPTKVISVGDQTNIGVHTEGVDVLQRSEKGNLTEDALTLAKKETKTKKKKKAFGKSKVRETETITHQHLASTTVAAKTITKEATEKTIHLKGSQQSAGESITYLGNDLINETKIVADSKSHKKIKKGMVSKTTTKQGRETPSAAIAIDSAPIQNTMTNTAIFKGVVKEGKTINDGTRDGTIYIPATAEMGFHHSVKSKQPIAKSDCGIKGGQEVLAKTNLNVQTIVRVSSDNVVISDGTIRYIQPISGDDNACAIVSLLFKVPGFDKKEPRKYAGEKLLQSLEDIVLQPTVCVLIAPEIQEGALMFGGAFSTLPGANKLIEKSFVAQGIVDDAVRKFREVVGEEETSGLKPEELLELNVPEENLVPLKEALKELDATETEKKVWCTDPDTVRAFINTFVLAPGWMLGYASEHAKGATGVMEALAFIHGLNFKVFRDTSLTKGVEINELVHKAQFFPSWPTVELVHVPFNEMATEPNHFNLLEKNPVANPGREGKMKLTSVEWDINKTEVIGEVEENTYEPKSWQKKWAKQSQVIPKVAVIVIAIAVSITTSGAGGALLASAIGTMTGGAMTASAVGACMASAGFTTLCSTAATCMATHGDPFATMEHLASNDFLRSAAISVATAGAAHGLGDHFNVNMASGVKNLVDHAQEHAIRNGASLAVRAVAGEKIGGKEILNAVKDTAIDAVAAKGANYLGGLSKVNLEEKTFHKAGHFVNAFFAGGLKDPNHFVKNGLSAGTGAVAGEMAAEAFANYSDISPETSKEEYDILKRKWVDMSRIIVAIGAAALDLNVHAADWGATNALENNFLTSQQLRTEDEEKVQRLLDLAEGEPEASDVADEIQNESLQLPTEEDQIEGLKNLALMGSENAENTTSECHECPKEEPKTLAQNGLDILSTPYNVIKEFANEHPNGTEYTLSCLDGAAKGADLAGYFGAALAGGTMGGPNPYAATLGAVVGAATYHTATQAAGTVLNAGTEAIANMAGNQGATSQKAKQYEEAVEGILFVGAMMTGKGKGGKAKNPAPNQAANANKTLSPTKRVNKPKTTDDLGRSVSYANKSNDAKVEKLIAATNSNQNKSGKNLSGLDLASEKKGLLPTDFSKDARAYVRDMENRSGVKINTEQRGELANALRKEKFEKLDPSAKIKHGKEYEKARPKMISEWEDKTKNGWPTYSDDFTNKSGKVIAKTGDGHQLHHIIPQQHGGENKWWNVHPLSISDHQGGVHKADAPLKKIIKELDNGK